MNPQGVNHYENFPVASWLCPPRLRTPIAAVYRFARTADDLADEGHLSATTRLEALSRYRQQLGSVIQGVACTEWPQIFDPLAIQIQQHQLPVAHLHALLDAFEQDVRYTEMGHHYGSIEELLDYTTRSAQPVGRLLLHLYGVNDAQALAQSDAICTALQLINFWQDLGHDLPRGRYYVPQEALAARGLALHDLLNLPNLEPNSDTYRAAQSVVLDLCAHARELMWQGAPLAWALPGRLGWELRLVVQGGLHILQEIEAIQGQTWCQRPQLQAKYLPALFWRAWRMPHALKGRLEGRTL